MLEFLIRAVVIGAGATALLDIWGQVLKATIGWPATNWAMPGRWLAHLFRGQFAHDDIGKAEPVPNERAIGWVFHYVVGILFAAVLLAIWGLDWARNPTFLPALIVGLVTVGCGWFILAPGMGAGIAASKKPNANRIRLMNVIGHIVFAIGLYGSALLTR
ncbi:DUF2938 domain-containing protein [Bosea sp. PAMC 26642]|uniref:DUF2938 domain-containing protein n=1 Tax=Bosea sp. (strain PAMC 26642) TaxID=1792307 RepID=UPI00077055DE|nr:DUF2938 domain-containing protein [Bosea sp. PAMC 26642]AMJ62081.1 hypothetical protein AXW83_18845 [Bosea sp. PAMC 26642]